MKGTTLSAAENTLKRGHRTAPFGVHALACPILDQQLNWRGVIFWTAVALLAFHIAYALPQTGFLILGYLFALLQLSRARIWRRAYYSGLSVGLGIAAVQLSCFVQIFSFGAVALWLVYAFWIGLFVALAQQC